MGQRLQLQSDLETILGSGNVYFQPPANVQMQYPAIVYNRDRRDTKFADNVPYRLVTRYQVTIITNDPESEIVDKVAALPMSTFARNYSANNLVHDVYNLYF